MKICKVATGVDVLPMMWALQSNPRLWDQNKLRTAHPESPHNGVNDIWVRYAKNPDEHKEHDSVWYPAAEVLPVFPLAMEIMTFAQGERLGGILITRIPPGGEVKPHTDTEWHARYYQKLAIQLASAPGQRFCFDDEELETKPGDVFWFNNQQTHWVVNPTQWERITLIFCVKTDKRFMPCLGG